MNWTQRIQQGIDDDSDSSSSLSSSSSSSQPIDDPDGYSSDKDYVDHDKECCCCCYFSPSLSPMIRIGISNSSRQWQRRRWQRITSLSVLRSRFPSRSLSPSINNSLVLLLTVLLFSFYYN